MSRTEQDEAEYADTLEDAARALRVSHRTVKRYVRGIGLQKTPAGWPLGPLKVERDCRLAELAASPDGARLLRARADREEARVEREKLELEIRRGKYVTVARRDEEGALVVSLILRCLDEVSGRWPPALVGLEERAMRTKIHALVKELRTRIVRAASLYRETEAAAAVAGESVTAVQYAEAIYAAAFGEKVPALAPRGDPLAYGWQIVEAAVSKIRELRGEAVAP